MCVLNGGTKLIRLKIPGKCAQAKAGIRQITGIRTVGKSKAEALKVPRRC